MGKYLKKYWKANYEEASRRERMGGQYQPYLPDTLCDWRGAISLEAMAESRRAEEGINALNNDSTVQKTIAGLARFLLRVESVGSSQIEGLSVSSRRLAKAEAALKLGVSVSDSTASEVLGNIEAMEFALRLAEKPSRLEVDDLCQIHQILMDRSPTPQIGGVIRDVQNWIGGNDYNPCDASFVPPPPEYVVPLMDDLIDYLDTDHHAPLIQAALAHAQFEVIHPFADGNGRTGRALIHIALARRGLTAAFTPPVSLVLATWSKSYVAGLKGFCVDTEPDGLERVEGASQWIEMFSSAVIRASDDVRVYADRVAELEAEWRSKVGKLRSDSSANLLLSMLAGTPIVTVEQASELLGRSQMAVGQAVNQLLEAGVLRQFNIGKQRYRVFEAIGAFDLFTSLERSLASPTGDTATAQPSRPAPDRPSRR